MTPSNHCPPAGMSVFEGEGAFTLIMGSREAPPLAAELKSLSDPVRRRRPNRNPCKWRAAIMKSQYIQFLPQKSSKDASTCGIIGMRLSMAVAAGVAGTKSIG